MTNADMIEEMGMTGDCRRCPTHGCATSSPDGMFDAPCGACEAEMDNAEMAACEAEVATPAPAPITLHEALKVVSNQCDHATTHDTVGFSGLDARFANDIAQKEIRTAKQEWYVARFVRKYRRQVIEAYERKGVQITQGLKGKAKSAAVDAFLCALVWEHQTAEKVAEASTPKLVVSCASGAETGTVKHFVVRFPYNPALVFALKDAIDWRDRSFDRSNAKDPKWTVSPVPASVAALRAFASKHGFFVTPGAAAAFAALAPKVAA